MRSIARAVGVVVVVVVVVVVGAGRAQWIRVTPPSPGPGLDTRQRTEQTGLCRGQTAYSGNGEPGYPKWPGAVAILVPSKIQTQLPFKRGLQSLHSQAEIPCCSKIEAVAPQRLCLRPLSLFLPSLLMTVAYSLWQILFRNIFWNLDLPTPPFMPGSSSSVGRG